MKSTEKRIQSQL